ncbi:MAG TPA: FAD-dependent oxidoreductase, partial [Hyphomicrobiaceae bacterium]|nr:FAD-dependent oxidoreductase [Hyphomicrobiaceae bacterium]
MVQTFDFIVIGAGVAGASAAAALCRRGKVCLIEQEAQAGYHSTSRSAAVSSDAYGTRSWQILTSASRRFFLDPPAGFAERGLGWKLAQDGALVLNGTLPISTFGGLKARGNPVGATGV